MWTRCLWKEDVCADRSCSGREAEGVAHAGGEDVCLSRALKEIDNSEVDLVREGASEFVRRLKGLPGRELCLLGGGELAQSLMAAGLVDRVRLNIHPVLLGAGTPAFRDTGARVKLRLTEGRAIEGGCVLANYEVLR